MTVGRFFPYGDGRIAAVNRPGITGDEGGNSLSDSGNRVFVYPA
ncbi:MAG: hypothetical protein AAFN92_07310 [Bacteroidota bacterium]